MDWQEQESIWKQAGELAQRMLIRKLSMQIRNEIPTQGEKIDIPHPIKGKQITYSIVNEVTLGEGKAQLGERA